MATTFSARSAEGYERIMGQWSRRLAPKLIEFAGVSAGDRVLDVGCGTGSLTAALAGHPNLAAIVGIDLAEPYVDFTRRQLLADPRVTVEVGDACALPYPDRAFDRTLSLLVLQFVPEPERAVREMQRVVCSGGTVAAAVWDSYGGLPHIRMLWDTAAALDPAAADARALFRPLNRPGELAELWRRVGLAKAEESSLVIRIEFADFEDYWRPFLSGDGPPGQFVTALSDEARDRLKIHLRRAYASNRPNGPRSFVAVAWACKGVVE
jgi:SAM-dependent methyltransferase